MDNYICYYDLLCHMLLPHSPKKRKWKKHKPGLRSNISSMIFAYSSEGSEGLLKFFNKYKYKDDCQF